MGYHSLRFTHTGQSVYRLSPHDKYIMRTSFNNWHNASAQNAAASGWHQCVCVCVCVSQPQGQLSCGQLVFGVEVLTCCMLWMPESRWWRVLRMKAFLCCGLPLELENDWQRKYECCLLNDAHQSGQSASTLTYAKSWRSPSTADK